MIRILVLMFNINIIYVHSRCPSYLITTNDIQIAVKASSFVYNKTVVGKKIPGTNFKIIHSPVDFIYTNGTGVKVIIAEYKDTTVVAFRGTHTTSQLIRQLKSAVINHRGYSLKSESNNVTINAFFWKAFHKLYDDIEPYLNDGKRKYIITGHSLGGAMASILAFVGKLSHSIWDHEESSLITFGQPRVGDLAYANKHDEMISTYRKLRFINGRDPIPQLTMLMIPPMHHHSREVWMSQTFWTEKKYWKICPRQDTLSCSKSYRWLPNKSDHEIAKYELKIHHLPKYFIDKYKYVHKTWKKTLINSCM